MPTPKQVAALKYMIAKAPGICSVAKKILFFMIDSSEALTLPISVTITDGVDGYTKDTMIFVARALDVMSSSNGTIHLDVLMQLSGSDLLFSYHYGHYERDEFDSEGMFGGPTPNAPGHENDRPNMPLRYTIWLAKKLYGHDGKGKFLHLPTFEEVCKINLNKPGLYPELEPKI